MKLYFDTVIWNRSLEQQVDAKAALCSLADHGHQVVLGLHAFHELQKAFHSESGGTVEKGRKLFQHLDEYLAAGLLLIAKETRELLHAELCVLRGENSIGKFLGLDDLGKVVREIQQFKNAKVAPKWAIATLEMEQRNANQRDELKHEFLNNEPLRQAFQKISKSDLKIWIETECKSLASIDRLALHIKYLFPEASSVAVLNDAIRLVESDVPIALGILKADLYFHWRCANAGSVPRDLLDDGLHILNATYCDVYVTAEPHQTTYASLLLPKHARVEIYDHQKQSLKAWLAEFR